jgi:hypothetical protein
MSHEEEHDDEIEAVGNTLIKLVTLQQNSRPPLPYPRPTPLHSLPSAQQRDINSRC